MAFFKCGGSKTATIIDGVESGKDLKLKSLGLRDLGIITPRIPESVLGNLTYSYYSTYDGYVNIVPFQGKLYFIYSYSSLIIFQYEVDTNTWIKIGNITTDLDVRALNWAKEINGIIYLFISERYRQSICHIEFTSNGINLIRDSVIPGTKSNEYYVYAYGSDIYFFEGVSSYLYKFSTTTKTWTELVSFDNEYIRDIKFIKKINDELHIYTVYEYYDSDWNEYSYYLYKYLCKITDQTITRIEIALPYNNSNKFKFLYINNVLHVILEAPDSNSCYVPVLFKFEDDIFTQIDNSGDINSLLSASTFNFNNEIWYRNAELDSGEGETLRLGKFSEVYELTK